MPKTVKEDVLLPGKTNQIEDRLNRVERELKEIKALVTEKKANSFVVADRR